MGNKVRSHPESISRWLKLCGVPIASLVLCSANPSTGAEDPDPQTEGATAAASNLTEIEKYRLAAIVEKAIEIANDTYTIGAAVIDRKGVITMYLVADYDDGRLVHGTIVKKPGDADYESVLKHIGPIKPGESKPVYPFPNKPSE